ncbi:MAG TPA: CoA transferase [Candidatus Dormibacteraeota bacterium]|nr:CoA transferase [Candidatus Dormibacteraeota bacterium]
MTAEHNHEQAGTEQGPLAGIRVLEVGNYMAAPFCCMQLADLGAEVIKIENPDGGDQVRQSAPLIDGEGSAFMRLNRNKRSIALDLKSEPGKEIFRKLVATSDVVVENLRPGTMGDLQLDYERLRTINPGLVYVAASGWGQDGPLRDQPGMDIMAQARSGLMSITGLPGGDPVKVGVPLCDLVCALYGALAAVTALYARRVSGAGQFIDVSLLEAGVSLAIWEAGAFFATGEVPKPSGSAHQSAAPYQAFRSADGWLTIGATTKFNWTALCRTLGLERLQDDSRYADASLRHRNREELASAIEAVTVTKPTAHWLAALGDAGVPCAPIQDFGQVFTDPHLLARHYFWDAPHAKVGVVRQLGSPMRFSRTPARRGMAGPLLGEDSAALLAELGYGPAEVSTLVEQRVVAIPTGEPASS